ncbi:hypothetical protein [Brachybacterium saurashtrense]|uniref:hypothetical protein n=1 Tax=Brachybacterium saurashtrense TaxID=556288 RepID=UPI000F8D18BD|nr:hypothetical protein [Brachybacterium saurashtrense]
MTTATAETTATGGQRPSVASVVDVAADETDVLAALKEAGKELAKDAPPLTSEQVDRVVAILRLSDEVDA